MVKVNLYRQKIVVEFENPTCVFIDATTVDNIKSIVINEVEEMAFLKDKDNNVVAYVLYKVIKRMAHFICDEQGCITNYGKTYDIIADGELQELSDE